MECRRTWVIAHVHCSGSRRSGLSRILTSVCHMAVVSSRQNAQVSQHDIVVNRTVLEKGRVRSLSVDPADQFHGPCQNCSHVGTILGRAPQFHAVGHARCYAGTEDDQFRRRTGVLAAQDWQPLVQCRPAVGRASCLLSGPASCRLKAQSLRGVLTVKRRRLRTAWVSRRRPMRALSLLPPALHSDGLLVCQGDSVFPMQYSPALLPEPLRAGPCLC